MEAMHSLRRWSAWAADTAWPEEHASSFHPQNCSRAGMDFDSKSLVGSYRGL